MQERESELNATHTFGNIMSSNDPPPMHFDIPPPSGNQDEDGIRDDVSIASVESVIKPPDRIKKNLMILVAVLSLFTLAEVVICSYYSFISGRAAHFYHHPETWQFCIIYASSTIAAYDQKSLDNVPTTLSILGLQTCLFSWVALAASWRALYHHEWIPSTLCFLVYNIFGLLVYYQNTPMITFPQTFVTSLLSVTKYLRQDLYDNMGKYCFNFEQKVIEVAGIPQNLPWTEYYPGLSAPNCTNDLVSIDASLLGITNAQDQLIAIANSTIPNSKLDCEGAVTLNNWYLVVQYFFVAVAAMLLCVMIHAEYYRQKNKRVYRQRWLDRGSHTLLTGTLLPKIMLVGTAIGNFMEMSAKQDASFVALDSTKNWPLIDLTGEGMVAVDYDGLPVTALYRYFMTFNVSSWLPSRKTYINIQTILILVTTMSVVRGSTRQSVSAYRLGAVSSGLYVLTVWPMIIGNFETMTEANLWPWMSGSNCNGYFEGIQALYPSHEQSERLCADTRWAALGAFIAFVSMNVIIVACLKVFIDNKTRLSMDELDVEAAGFDPQGSTESPLVDAIKGETNQSKEEPGPERRTEL